ncbi:hypothetical protein SBBP2_750004 [Burkholderiales bacterium]|nr:hypothetical protein SBBP2_750004 [Burkholderiales bacterium]
MTWCDRPPTAQLPNLAINAPDDPWISGDVMVPGLELGVSAPRSDRTQGRGARVAAAFALGAGGPS